MPWKETSPVEERLRFVARLLEGEAMAALCREFCISRKTGHDIVFVSHQHRDPAHLLALLSMRRAAASPRRPAA